MRAWVMAERTRSIRRALAVAEIHLTRRAAIAAARGVLPDDEFELREIEVRLLPRRGPAPAATNKETPTDDA